MADFLRFLGGAVVLGAFLGALLMLYHRHMYRMYKRMAHELAKEMFREYVRGCEYRIHTLQRITIIDETGGKHGEKAVSGKITQTHYRALAGRYEPDQDRGQARCRVCACEPHRPRVYEGRSAQA